jgi:hypothetical protein
MTTKARRCTSRYTAQVRCEERIGHDGPHGHSFFARYWTDDEARDAATPLPEPFDDTARHDRDHQGLRARHLDGWRCDACDA